jgi:hypothetical protein
MQHRLSSDSRDRSIPLIVDAEHNSILTRFKNGGFWNVDRQVLSPSSIGAEEG